jgi:ABC-type transporter lipoprotein component MlaA
MKFDSLTHQEITYLMTAMQNVSTRMEALYQQQCQCDSRQLYVKLYDAWETLQFENAN